MEKLNISFEFFPPKTEKMYKNLWNTINKLKIFQPDFVSVTYGAGGSTRERTHDTIKKLLYETSIKPIPHLTCIGDTKDSIKTLGKKYWEVGIRSIVALRGDLPSGVSGFGDFPYALDLIKFIKE